MICRAAFARALGAALLLALLALGLWWLAPRVELELALHWAAPLTLSLGAGLR
jgi:hypothetical protein